MMLLLEHNLNTRRDFQLKIKVAKKLLIVSFPNTLLLVLLSGDRVRQLPKDQTNQKEEEEEKDNILFLATSKGIKEHALRGIQYQRGAMHHWDYNHWGEERN